MHKKEKLKKDVVLRVQPSLFKRFQKTCEKNYKTVSEVMRELMQYYIHKEMKESEDALNEKENRTEM